MPKYLLEATYTTEGKRGLVDFGGTKRREAVEESIRKAGGHVEAFYFAFGDADAYVIADLPDNVSATALALAVASSGLVRIKTSVLVTPEEVDEAVRMNVAHRTPVHRYETSKARGDT
ncbi:MAG: GYD domain-containing protein [SAR202 cluster bacterium]|nr:GYD domain-containing protein [SAR202 cluster bacterium]